MREQKWSKPKSLDERMLRLAVREKDELYEPRRAYERLNRDPMQDVWRPISIDDPGPEARAILKRAKRRQLEDRIFNLILWANVVAAWAYVFVWAMW